MKLTLLLDICLVAAMVSLSIGWTLVFHAVKGNGQNVRVAWDNGSIAGCTPDLGCIPGGFKLENWRNNGKHLRSPLIDQWNSLNIVKIRVVFGGLGKTLAFLEFDGSGSNKEDWFSKSRLLHSSWSDLKSSSHTNFFSMNGHNADLKRHFFINKQYGECPNDIGWLVVIDRIPVCPWENKGDYPLFLYSKSLTASNWNHDTGSADVMNVYILTI
ncbi:uncharacterized protein LOC133201704 [Saccostrea echinata]|uniref:uncharacterized protein LOC133201704 n=1 Tax=Saccostrea echinata TaxID=191078 RepID=UPI002A7F1D10|nr:uncharacterized protein LOC133201704 [Saccostrea echinata]